MLSESLRLGFDYGLCTEEEAMCEDFAELGVADEISGAKAIGIIKDRLACIDARLEKKEEDFEYLVRDRLNALTTFDIVSGEADQEDTLTKRLMAAVDSIGEGDLGIESPEDMFSVTQGETELIREYTNELVTAKPSLKRTRKEAEKLEKIREAQESGGLAIGRAEFGPVVAELLYDLSDDLLCTPAAAAALQTAAEEFLTETLSAAGNAAVLAGRDTVLPQDLKRRRVK